MQTPIGPERCAYNVCVLGFDDRAHQGFGESFGNRTHGSGSFRRCLHTVRLTEKVTEAVL